jgi:hypothetical protein
MVFQPPPVLKPPFDPRKFPRFDLSWTLTGNVVQDYNPLEGIPDVTIKVLDAVNGMEAARTTTKAKGDFALQVPAGPSTGYLVRPEKFLYSFMPIQYRVTGSMKVPTFTGHNNK